MRSAPANRFRSLLLIPCCGPLVVGAAIALVPADGPVIPVAIGVSLVVAVASAGMGWILSRPVGELAAAIAGATDGGEATRLPTSRQDELGSIATHVAELLKRIASLERRAERAETATSTAETQTKAANEAATNDRTKFATSLDHLAKYLGAVANGTPTSPLTIDAPNGVAVDRIQSATQDLTTKVNFVRQKLNAFHRVLQSTPVAVVATDDKGIIRFANAVAEKVLGRTSAELLRTPLTVHVKASDHPDPAGLAPLPVSGIPEWLATGGNAAAAESAVGTPLALSATRSATPSDSLWCITLRDLTDDHARIGGVLARTREEGFATSLAMADRVVSNTGEVILAQTRQLISEAKQTPQREALVPRLRSIQQSANDLDAQARITRTLATILWGEVPPPMRVEFLAGESVRSVVDQLSARLTARNTTVTIADAGGWVYCDEEWFRTAVHGALAHATASVRDNPIGVKLRRLPCKQGEKEGRLEVEIVDAGPALTAADHASLAQPFGSLIPSGFVPPPGTDGYLPGLLLANRMTTELGGELAFGETPSGRLIIRMVIPTRLPDRMDTPTDVATQPDVGHPEELCCGWKLGVAS